MSEFVCTINGYETRQTWGVTFGDGSLSALQTPPALKTAISNESRAINGKQTLPVYAVKDRDVSLTFWLSASSISEFNSRYQDFLNHIMYQPISLETKFEPGVVYHLDYVSCTQYKVYNGTMAKFVIKFNEPDPTNRY